MSSFYYSNLVRIIVLHPNSFALTLNDVSKKYAAVVLALRTHGTTSPSIAQAGLGAVAALCRHSPANRSLLGLEDACAGE